MQKKEIKTEEKVAMKGKLGIMWLITILFNFLTMSWMYTVVENVPYFEKFNIKAGVVVINPASMVALLLNVLLIGVFIVGYIRIFIDVAQQKKPEVQKMFSNAKYFGKAILLTLIYNVILVVGLLLFIVPGIVWGLMFGMASNIYAQNPDKSVIECLKQSKEIMNGKKSELFNLMLSYYGWAVLVFIAYIIAFGVAAVFNNLMPNTLALLVSIILIVGLVIFASIIDVRYTMAETIFYLSITGQDFNGRKASKEKEQMLGTAVELTEVETNC